MILFSFPEYENIARQLRTSVLMPAGRFSVDRYANQELHARIESSVSGEHCLLLGTIAPPDECLLSILLLAETLEKEGADKITAVLPYLAYSRQDKDKSGESLGTAWVGALLRSSGIDQILTVDVHSERAKQLIPTPLISLSTEALFADVIQYHNLGDATIVAPDNGAIVRCEAVMRAAGIASGTPTYFEKKRTDQGIVHQGPIGAVGPRAVIIDDLIDTGGTLLSACEKLRKSGVQEMYVLATHGLFTGTSWMQLWSLGVKQIFCTDTIPLRRGIETGNISVVSIATMMCSFLTNYQDSLSLSVERK